MLLNAINVHKSNFLQKEMKWSTLRLNMLPITAVEVQYACETLVNLHNNIIEMAREKAHYKNFPSPQFASSLNFIPVTNAIGNPTTYKKQNKTLTYEEALVQYKQLKQSICHQIFALDKFYLKYPTDQSIHLFHMLKMKLQRVLMDCDFQKNLGQKVTLKFGVQRGPSQNLSRIQQSQDTDQHQYTFSEDSHGMFDMVRGDNQCQTRIQPTKKGITFQQKNSQQNEFFFSQQNEPLFKQFKIEQTTAQSKTKNKNFLKSPIGKNDGKQKQRKDSQKNPSKLSEKGYVSSYRKINEIKKQSKVTPQTPANNQKQPNHKIRIEKEKTHNNESLKNIKDKSQTNLKNSNDDKTQEINKKSPYTTKSKKVDQNPLIKTTQQHTNKIVEEQERKEQKQQGGKNSKQVSPNKLVSSIMNSSNSELRFTIKMSRQQYRELLEMKKKMQQKVV